MYVVSRADLAPGDRATQANHAAFEFAVAHPQITADWCPGTLILLEVADEPALLALANAARSRGIAATVTREPDLGNAATAVAFAPSTATQRLCANLPLMLRRGMT